MTNNVWLLVAVCLTAAGTTSAAHSQQTPIWKDRFVNEAPREWAAFRAYAKCLQGTCAWTIRDKTAGNRVVVGCRFEFKQNENCALLLEQALSDTAHGGGLNAVNSRYGFQLHRSSSDASWAVAGTDLSANEVYALEVLGPKIRLAGMLDAPFKLDYSLQGFLPELVQDPDFAIKKVSPVFGDGAQLVQVDFTCRPNQLPSRKVGTNEVPSGTLRLRSGSVLLDPARHWVIRGYSVEKGMADQNPEFVTGKLRYRDGRNGSPIVSLITMETRRTDRKGAPVELEETHEFQLTEQDDVPESEFTLSAYGFPEPAGIEWKKPLPWYIWAGMLGCIAIVLALVIRRLGRRVRSASA